MKNEQKRFSEEVVKEIVNRLKKYVGQKVAKNETKTVITDVYKSYYVEHKVTQDTIKDYYEATPQNGEQPNKWKIKRLLPQFEKLLQE